MQTPHRKASLNLRQCYKREKAALQSLFYEPGVYTGAADSPLVRYNYTELHRNDGLIHKHVFLQTFQSPAQELQMYISM